MKKITYFMTLGVTWVLNKQNSTIPTYLLFEIYKGLMLEIPLNIYYR